VLRVFHNPSCENACNATQLGITAIRLGPGVLRRFRVDAPDGEQFHVTMLHVVFGP
jgi:hypothetical protein